jgi:hypothetical protein
MTLSTRRILGAGLLVFLLTQPAEALIPDPVENALLTKIVAVLNAIEQLRMRILERMQEQIRNRLRTDAFPPQLFGAIGTTTATVVDIRRQLQRMACDWGAPGEPVPPPRTRLPRSSGGGCVLSHRRNTAPASTGCRRPPRSCSCCRWRRDRPPSGRARPSPRSCAPFRTKTPACARRSRPGLPPCISPPRLSRRAAAAAS